MHADGCNIHMTLSTVGICTLPMELIAMIFCELDVPTLFVCKQVSLNFWNQLKRLGRYKYLGLPTFQQN